MSRFHPRPAEGEKNDPLNLNLSLNLNLPVKRDPIFACFVFRGQGFFFPSRDTVTTPANIGLSRRHDVSLESPGYRGEKNSQRPTPPLLRREGMLELEIWSLEFLWNLKLGIWSL